ncbi:unnamed protein product [Durusdinium trenchii]
MGRRHFLFGPPPRALQGSILEGCQVRNDAPSALVDSEHVQTRRHFNLEEGTRGATTSSFEIASKRRFDALEHKEHGREVIESYYGRKHLLGPECHMQGALQVKSAEVQRRRQETSQPTLRRGDTPQRRHLVSQDHLLWSGAVSGRCADQAPPQGLRRSEPSPTLDSQVANLLVDPAREAMAQAAPLLCYGPRSQTPVKRRVEVADNLVGGTLRGAGSLQQAEKSEKILQRRLDDGTSLLGGHLREPLPMPFVDDAARPLALPSRSPQRPQDHLAGGACLPVSAH